LAERDFDELLPYLDTSDTPGFERLEYHWNQMRPSRAKHTEVEENVLVDEQNSSAAHELFKKIERIYPFPRHHEGTVRAVGPRHTNQFWRRVPILKKMGFEIDTMNW
jgi:hypothetical protein